LNSSVADWNAVEAASIPRPRPASIPSLFWQQQALLAHELEIVKLAFRIHRPLRYEETPTLPAFRQRQTKESFIQSDETVTRHFRLVNREGAPFGDAFSDAQQVVVSRLRDGRRRIIVRPARE
jgi:hypothetical protein